MLQSPTKTVPFYLLPHYKSIWQDRENDLQYWKEIIVEFIKQKHNSNTSWQGFPIKMYLREPPHEPFFITYIMRGNSYQLYKKASDIKCSWRFSIPELKFIGICQSSFHFWLIIYCTLWFPHICSVSILYSSGGFLISFLIVYSRTPYIFLIVNRYI